MLCGSVLAFHGTILRYDFFASCTVVSGGSAATHSAAPSGRVCAPLWKLVMNMPAAHSRSFEPVV